MLHALTTTTFINLNYVNCQIDKLDVCEDPFRKFSHILYCVTVYWVHQKIAQKFAQQNHS